MSQFAEFAQVSSLTTREQAHSSESSPSRLDDNGTQTPRPFSCSGLTKSAPVPLLHRMRRRTLEQMTSRCETVASSITLSWFNRLGSTMKPVTRTRDETIKRRLAKESICFCCSRNFLIRARHQQASESLASKLGQTLRGLSRAVRAPDEALMRLTSAFCTNRTLAPVANFLIRDRDGSGEQLIN